MRKLLLFILIIPALTQFGQIVSSNCQAGDSITKKYKDDADKLAVARVFHINSPYKDSVHINKPISQNYLNALLAVYNATTLPARDTIVTLKIHKIYYPVVNSLLVEADSGLAWMKNFRYNIFPSGNSAVDNLCNTYYLKKDVYYAWQLPHALLVLKTDTNCNINALANKFQAIPIVYISEPNALLGDGNDITDSVGANFTLLTYSYGWGDCMSGCGDRRYWQFKVYNDCSVEYVGSYGNALPPSSLVGLKENSEELNQICLYPNPVEGKLTIELKTKGILCNLTIHNSLGQEMLFQKSEFQKKEIDISSFKSGIYFLTLQSNSERKTIKILKQ